MNGWTLTVLGLFVAFLAMGIFVLVITALKAVFPYKEEPEEEEMASEVEPEPSVASSSIEAEVAAIAVAIVASRQKNRSPIGASLLEGRGSWWSASRNSARQTSSLNKNN